MVQRSLIAVITIPNYIRRVKISNSVRAKYFEWDGTTIKSGSKKLWKKCVNPVFKNPIILNDGNVTPIFLKDNFIIIDKKSKKPLNLSEWYNEKQKWILAEKVGMELIPVVANPTKVGEPNYFIINGQAIYNHTASPFTTGKVFDAIKHMYYKKFKQIPEPILEELRKDLSNSYPIMITMEIQDTVKNAFDNSKDDIGRIWDVGNRTDPYMKTFLDFLTHGYKDKHDNVLLEPIIEDDDRLHVTTGNNSFFTPITELQEPTLRFHIYSDDREIWKTINKKIK